MIFLLLYLRMLRPWQASFTESLLFSKILFTDAACF